MPAVPSLGTRTEDKGHCGLSDGRDNSVPGAPQTLWGPAFQLEKLALKA